MSEDGRDIRSPTTRNTGGYEMGVMHFFNTDVAVRYGVNCAILLENIRYWVDKNKANEQNLHDGKYWTYNSKSAFSILFPYMSYKQIRTALDTLRDEGLVETGTFSDNPYDRTLWYTVTEKGMAILSGCTDTISPTGPIRQPDTADTMALQGQCYTVNKPYSKPDNKLEETRVSKDTLPKEKSGKSAKTGPFVVNNLYVESQTRENGIPSVNQLVYPGKDSIGKDSIMSGNEAENGNSDVKTIIEYLNLKAKKSFRATTKLYERHINARLSEGYTLEDFKHVIDVKCAEWMNTDHEQYLRPDTLFAPSHFDSYLNQKIVKAKPKSAIYFSNDECREQMKNETPTF